MKKAYFFFLPFSILFIIFPPRVLEKGKNGFSVDESMIWNSGILVNRYVYIYIYTPCAGINTQGEMYSGYLNNF